MSGPELPRDQWRQFFDKLTQDYEGFDVTIEVLSPDLGDQVEAERLPLASLAYDERDDAFIAAVGGQDRRYPVQLRHIIEHPRAIYSDELTDETPWVIDVIGPDDTQTIITIRRRPALPPPR
jgi:hypothetical protein